MIELIANAAGEMLSGDWVLKLVGAMFTGAALILGRLWGRKESETREVTLKKPVPTVVTREEPQWATRPDLDDHEARTKAEFSEVWKAIDGERKIARDALGNIHKRLDNQSTATATLQGTVNEVKDNVGKLLDLALHRKPPTGR